MSNINQFPYPSLQGTKDPRVFTENISPPSGYSIYSGSEMASANLGRTAQAFTALSSTAFPSDNTLYYELHNTGLPTKSEVLWLITVSAIEILQTSRERVSYQKASQIFSAQGTNPPRYSIFQAKASWSDGSAKQNVVYFDIAGTSSLLVMARSVTVGILSPDPTYWIETDLDPELNNKVPQLEGIVVNAVLSARVAPQVVPRTTCNSLKFTKRITTVSPDGGTEPAFVEIPPAARKVRIYNCNETVSPGDMFFWIGKDPTVGYSQGIINFNGDSTEELLIPAFATHIFTGSTNTSFFNFVFSIDP
jgi:hypothetical protein